MEIAIPNDRATMVLIHKKWTLYRYTHRGYGKTRAENNEIKECTTYNT